MTGAPDVLVVLPEAERAAFKEPLGAIYTEAETLLEETGRPLVTVGDMVSFHLIEAGVIPDVALVDGRTNRASVDPAIEERLQGQFEHRLEANNPSGTITASLLASLREALQLEGGVRISVDGEEDLATIPAVLLARNAASIVYGQPGEGMVHVPVTPANKRRVRELLDRMEGDADRLRAGLAR